MIHSMITIDDGVTNVSIDAYATIGLQQDFDAVGGGSSVLRMVDGTGVKQVQWQKLKITIQGYGWQPPLLNAIDWTDELTITIHDYESTTKQYTVLADRPKESWNVQKASATWTLECEEA